MPKVDRKVVVPKEIAAKWKSVKLMIETRREELQGIYHRSRREQAVRTRPSR